MHDYSTGTNCDAEQVLPTSTQRGWFMDLSHRGEQTVTSALIVGGMVTFSTARPGTAATGVCSRPSGIAEGYWLNLFNASGAIGVEKTCGGQRSNPFAGGGMPPSPVLAMVPVAPAGDGGGGGAEIRLVAIGAIQRSGATGTPISPQTIDVDVSGARERLYWSRDLDR